MKTHKVVLIIHLKCLPIFESEYSDNNKTFKWHALFVTEVNSLIRLKGNWCNLIITDHTSLQRNQEWYNRHSAIWLSEGWSWSQSEEQILAKFGGRSLILLLAYLETPEPRLRETLKPNPMSFHRHWPLLIASSAASPIDLATHSHHTWGHSIGRPQG